MGQNGGNGVTSSNGETCSIPQTRPRNQQEIEQCRKNSFSLIRNFCAILPIQVHFLVRSYHKSDSGVTRNRGDYKNYGKIPSPGGNGGRGGQGGKGGYAGSAIIYKIDENLTNYFEHMRKIEGNIGKDVPDGTGGNGAPAGCYYTCTRTWAEDSWGTVNIFKGFMEENNYWEEN